MKSLLAGLVAFALAVVSVHGQQTFTGTITDDVCPSGDHARMRMGPTNAECARACVDAHGAAYVLYDGKASYILTDQQKPAPFAGQRVRVVGTLDARKGTIQVDSIAAAP